MTSCAAEAAPNFSSRRPPCAEWCPRVEASLSKGMCLSPKAVAKVAFRSNHKRTETQRSILSRPSRLFDHLD